MEAALELEHLAKTYKTGHKKAVRKAVKDISFTIPAGTVFGLLGPNGAGKTTTIKMAIGFLKPDSGKVIAFGKNIMSVRDRVGFLPEQPYFYPHLTARAGLDFYAKLFCIKKALRLERSASLLHLVGLSDAADLPLGKFSKGMLQRFGIAQALINDPELLIVDEPASGLDPIGQVEMRNVLKKLNDEGKSILLSSHYLSEVENICHEVAVINKGIVIARGKIEDLLASGDIYAIQALNISDDWLPTSDVIKIERTNGQLKLTVSRNELEAVIDNVRSSGGFIEDIRRNTKSLEQLFLELVGGNGNGN